MLTLPALQTCLELLGTKVSVYAKDDGSTGLDISPPARGKLVPEIKTAIVGHKARLIELVAGGWSPVLITPDDRVTLPVLARRPWRTMVARWPIEWRERWGRLANDLQGKGLPWDAAELASYCELEPAVVDAEQRREIMCFDPGPGAFTDCEAAEAIDRAFGDDPAAVEYPTGSGPRDYRRGDRWLPWHFGPDGSPKPHHEPEEPPQRPAASRPDTPPAYGLTVGGSVI